MDLCILLYMRRFRFFVWCYVDSVSCTYQSPLFFKTHLTAPLFLTTCQSNSEKSEQSDKSFLFNFFLLYASQVPTPSCSELQNRMMPSMICFNFKLKHFYSYLLETSEHSDHMFFLSEICGCRVHSDHDNLGDPTRLSMCESAILLRRKAYLVLIVWY